MIERAAQLGALRRRQRAHVKEAGEGDMAAAEGAPKVAGDRRVHRRVEQRPNRPREHRRHERRRAAAALGRSGRRRRRRVADDRLPLFGERRVRFVRGEQLAVLARVVVVLVVVVSVLGPRVGGATAAVRTPSAPRPSRPPAAGCAARRPARRRRPRDGLAGASRLTKDDPFARGGARKAERVELRTARVAHPRVVRVAENVDGKRDVAPAADSVERVEEQVLERVIAQQRSPGAQRSKSVAVASSDSA